MPERPYFSAEGSVEAVDSRMGATVTPRLREAMRSLVAHLHAVVKETQLTAEEWLVVIDFLTRTGKTCTAERQEFILMSDVLGISMLVDAIRQGVSAATTESTVLGPFHVADSPWRELGDDICLQAGPGRGEALSVAGRVMAVDGVPIPGATLDVWQADDRGFYDVQRLDGVPAMNLRGRFRSGSDGRYAFRSVKPRSYPIPHDGPVGELLAALGRHPYRPAHIHFIVSAPGFEPVTTHVFAPDDPYLDSDAVFGVKPTLIREFRRIDGGPGLPAAWDVDCDFVLQAVGAH